MAKKEEEITIKDLEGLADKYVKQLPNQRQHEFNILVVKVFFLALLLAGATLLSIYKYLSQDFVAALYGAVLVYLIGIIKIK